MVRKALEVQIGLAEQALHELQESGRKAMARFSVLERQGEKLSTEKNEIVKQRINLYEQYADGEMSKAEFVHRRDAYREQEENLMQQIQCLRAEKEQLFQPMQKEAGQLQEVVDAVHDAGDVMQLSQTVVETFIEQIEVFNDERVAIYFTFEDVLQGQTESGTIAP